MSAALSMVIQRWRSATGWLWWLHGRLHGSAQTLSPASGLYRGQPPTSPSAVTLWVSMNSCPDWTVRFYPASHRQGLLCNDFLELDDQRLAALEKPIEVHAKIGTGVLFNALMLHGTGNPGSQRRVSCDIRFFPLCAFLPSTVHFLDEIL